MKTVCPSQQGDADPNPDPACHFDADPDLDPVSTFQYDVDQYESGSATLLPTSLQETFPSWTEFFIVSHKKQVLMSLGWTPLNQ